MQYVQFSSYKRELWVGRQEKFENKRACYWYEVVSAYENFVSNQKVPQVGLLGFACDQGVGRNQGRIGAKLAPDVIKSALAKLPVGSALLDRYGISRDDLSQLVHDKGNIHCIDNDEITQNALECAQMFYADAVHEMLNQELFVIGLGGGHEIAYGSFLGLWKHLHGTGIAKVPPRVGIINFDAHLDIRQSDVANSGTPFRQIAELVGNEYFHYMCIGASRFSNTAALFDRAKELGVTIISDDDCYRKSFDVIHTQLVDFIRNVDWLYITVDMDCFSSALVPGVSAPAAKGISMEFVEQCLEYLFQTQKVRVFDIAEINPKVDLDGRSSKVAARLVANVMEQHLLLTVY